MRSFTLFSPNGREAAAPNSCALHSAAGYSAEGDVEPQRKEDGEKTIPHLEMFAYNPAFTARALTQQNFTTISSPFLPRPQGICQCLNKM